MIKKIILLSISGAILITVFVAVFLYFKSMKVSETELDQVNKAYVYYDQYYTNELTGLNESAEEMSVVLSEVVKNGLLKKAYSKSEFKSNEEEYTGLYYELYDVLRVKKKEVFHSQILFLYFRCLLYLNQYDLYLTEFLNYYPYLNKATIVNQDYVLYLNDYANLSNEELDIVIEGFGKLRNACKEDEDIYVCTMSENVLYRIKKPIEVPDDVTDRIKDYMEKSGKFLLPFTWDGFDL